MAVTNHAGRRPIAVLVLGAAAVLVWNCRSPGRSVEPQASTYEVDLADLTTPAGSEKVAVAHVAPDFLTASGVSPALGRFFVGEEFKGEGAPVILSHAFWARRFGRDPSVIGTQIDVGARRRTIVGILPEAFPYPKDAAVLIPRTAR